MNRSWKTWLVFAVCALLIVGVMAGVTAIALGLDRSQAEARAQAELEEKVRLALWRMDSMLSPLVAQESARPYFTYSAFHPAERAYSRMYNPLAPSDVLVPSPLLTQVSTNILLHFQFDPGGRLTSPQIPEGNQRDIAEAQFTTPARIAAATAQLREFEEIMSRAGSSPELEAVANNRDVLFAAAPPATAPDTSFTPVLNSALEQQLQNAPQKKSGSFQAASQNARNNEELQARAQSLKQAYDVTAQNMLFANTREQDRLDVSEGLFKPVWFGNALVLVRRVAVQRQQYVQG